MPLYLKDKMVSGISLGVPGKSAYEQAKEGGYAGTEEEFAQILANAATTDYVDEAIGKIPTPDVSGQIEEHNTDENAHKDIRQAVSSAVNMVESKASKNTYSATITTTWVANGTGFKQTISITGILATDTPIIGLVQSGTITTDTTLREAWNMISRIECAENSIIVYCDEETPTIAIPIQIVCIR